MPRSSPFCRQLRERSEKNPSGCDRPEEHADVGGQEELPAAALGRSDYPVLPESSGGSEEVSPGKTQAAATAAAAASQRGRALQKGTLGFGTALSDAAGAEGRGRPEVGEGLAGEAALPAGLGSRRCAAVLRTVLEGQESAEESENGGSLRAAPPEAQCRHGEQDHAAAAQDKRAGTTRFSHPARLDDTAGHWELSCHVHGMCVCVCTLPLQHREMAELSQLLCSAEALLASEREANGRRRLRSEQEAREQEEKIGAVWEELSLLQQELDDSRRDKAELEEQMKVDKEETQQVRPGIDLSTGNEKVFPQTCFPTELRTSQQALFLFVVRCSSLDDHLIESPDYHSHGSSAYNLLLLLYPHLSVIRIAMSQGIFKLDLIVRKGKDFHSFPLRHR